MYLRGEEAVVEEEAVEAAVEEEAVGEVVVEGMGWGWGGKQRTRGSCRPSRGRTRWPLDRRR